MINNSQRKMYPHYPEPMSIIQWARPFAGLATLSFVALAGTAAGGARDRDSAQRLTVTRSANGVELALDGGSPFHVTTSAVTGERLITVVGSPSFAVIWEERDTGAAVTPWYAVWANGHELGTVKPTSYELLLNRATFDPLRRAPSFASSPLPEGGDVCIVQFVTQPLDAYTEALRDLGASVYHHVSNHAYLMRMTPGAREAARNLPFVRWIGDFHPEYRLEPELLEDLRRGAIGASERYVIQVFERGLHQKTAVAEHIVRLGGTIDQLHPELRLFQATMTPAQLVSVAARDEVLFVQRRTERSGDMDLVRVFSGADYLEAQTGFSGQDVQGEITDSGLDVAHPDFQHNGGVLEHGPVEPMGGHGTAVTGIVFADGGGSPRGARSAPVGQDRLCGLGLPGPRAPGLRG